MKKDQTPLIYRQLSQVDIRLKPEKYCHEVLKIICDNLGYHFGSILLVEEDGKGNIFSSYNLPKTYPQEVKKVKESLLSSPSGDAIQSGELVIVDNIDVDERLAPWSDLLNVFEIKTVIWIPLFKGGEAFGTYILYDKAKRSLSKNEFNLLNQLGALFSIVIMSSEYIEEIREQTERLEREITERKRIEEQLRIAKEKAEAASRAKTEFLSNMSHEIRTPMNAILGFSNILMDEENDPGKKEALEMIHGAGENLLSIITDILDLAKIEAGRLASEDIQFSCTKLSAEIQRVFLPQAEEKNLSFQVIVEPSVPKTVWGDRYKINKIISNVLKNAFKFTRKGHVFLRWNYDHQNKEALISISDTGIGIPEAKQEMIFEAFIQGDGSTTRQYGGTGLGLTIAGKMAHLLGGNITLSSKQGEGTTFFIRIPLKPGE